MPPSIASYDTDKFKNFVIGHNLPELKGKSVVLVLGRTGTGKSTAVGIQQGAIFEKDPDEKGYRLVSSHDDTPQTSSGFASKTLNIGAYTDKETGLVYLDTPGLNENRGDEEVLWVNNNLKFLFSILGNIESIIVMVNYSVCLGERGEGFEKLAEELSKITMNEPLFYQSMIFVVTQGYDEGKKISTERLEKDTKEKLADAKGKAERFRGDLCVRYPLSSTGHGIATVAGIMSGQGPQHAGFDIDKVSEDPEAKPKLDKFNATIFLLETFLKAIKEDKTIFSYPDGGVACRQLRQGIINKIKRSTGISAEQLVGIKERIPANTLLLFNKLSDLASSYLKNLDAEKRLMIEFKKQCEANEELFKATALNWKTVAERFLDERKKNYQKAVVELQEASEELSGFEKSIKEAVLRDDPVIKEKHGGWFWGWLTGVFGRAWARGQYIYDGQPFIRHSYEPQQPMDNPEIVEENGDRGKLQLNLRSHNGYDLNVRIKIYVLEKDLPSTKSRIEVLGKCIRNIRSELENLVNAVARLSALISDGSKEELNQEIMRDSAELQNKLKKINDFFQLPIDDMEYNGWDVVLGLDSLFSLLKEMNAFPAALPPADKKTIDDFLILCKERKENVQNIRYKEILNISVNTQRRVLRESIPAKNRLIWLYTNVNRATAGAVDSLNFMYHSNFYKDHQFTLGACTLLLGLAFMSPTFSQNKVLTCVIIIGVFNMLSRMAVFYEKGFEKGVRECRSVAENTVNSIATEGILTSQAARSFIAKMEENIKVHINLDTAQGPLAQVNAGLYNRIMNRNT